MTDIFFTVFGIYLFVLNFLGAIVVLVDKWNARHHGVRVPEKVLFLLAGLGGVPGVYIAMRAVRHKTLHKRFMIGLPLLFVVQTVVFITALVLVFRAVG